MNMQSREKDDTSAIYSPIPTRRDLVTAEIVEKGIALQELCGTKSAAEFLKFKMIAIDVVIRVLSRPSERRNCNTKTHAAQVLSGRTSSMPESRGGHAARGATSFFGWRH